MATSQVFRCGRGIEGVRIVQHASVGGGMRTSRLGGSAGRSLLAAGAAVLLLAAAPKDLSSGKKISTGTKVLLKAEQQIVGAVTDTTAKVSFRTTAAANVQVEYSTDPELADRLSSDALTTRDSSDFTVHVPLTGLLPETTYYYRILVNGVPQQVSPYPYFRTFTTKGVSTDFVFVVTSDTDHIEDDNGAPVYETLDAENPVFVVQIGDFDHSIPLTLEDMRAVHRSVRDAQYPAGADFDTHVANHYAFFHVWDDHDYGTNDSDKTFAGRADAIQAFEEYYPLPDDTPNPSAGIWHKFSYGQAEFYMLDTRSQRDPDLAPGGPDHSMLDGDLIPNGQKQWLKNELFNSTAKWKFIFTSVPFNPTAKKIPKDAWGGFTDERDELIGFMDFAEIKGVIFLSGDLHSGGGIDDGTHSHFPEVNVPHTNMPTGDTGNLGDWSEGIISGQNGRSGYALVHVMTNPDQVLLETKGREGTRISYVVTLP